MNLIKLNQKTISVSLSVLVSFLFVFAFATSTTTISSGGITTTGNFTTTGNLIALNLSVTGTTTLATTTINGVSYYWPSADGSLNQVLTTDGSGNLTWSTVASGGFTGGPLSAEYFTATSSTATSTFTNINFTGNFWEDGAPFVGSQWTTLSSNIYYNTGKVGIGTTSPLALLTVGSSTPTYLTSAQYYNSAYIAGQLEVGGTATSTFAGGLDIRGSSGLTLTNGSNYLNIYHNGTDAIFSTNSGEIQIGAGGDFVLDSGVNLGVGTSTPAYPLDVYGSMMVGTSLASSMFFDSATGNLGIGTTSPYAKLSVVGETVSTYFTATSSTATSTFTNINFTGNFWEDGAPFVGSQWTTLSSNIYYNTGKVGIGTTSPSGLLHIESGANSDSVFVIGTASQNYDSYISLREAGAEKWKIRNQGDNDDRLRIGSADNADVLTMVRTGNIGVGTTSPYAKLSVVGETVSAYFTATSSTATSTFTNINFTGNFWEDGAPFVGSQWTTSGSNIYFNTGSVGIGTTTPAALLNIFGTAEQLRLSYDADSYLSITHDGTDVTFSNNSGEVLFGAGGDFILDTGVNMGIGTTTPAYPLDIYGSFRVGTSTEYSTYFDSDLGILSLGTSTPYESGFLQVGGTGTSTFAGNLHVLGDLYAKTSFIGDLVFANAFRFVEDPMPINRVLQEGTQHLVLKNQRGESVLVIDENGNLTIASSTPADTSFISDGFQWVLGMLESLNPTKAVLKVWDGIVAAKEFIAEKVTAKQICVEDVCVDKNQFKELLEKNGIITNTNNANVDANIANPITEPTPEPQIETIAEVATSTPESGVVINNNVEATTTEPI